MRTKKYVPVIMLCLVLSWGGCREIRIKYANKIRPGNWLKNISVNYQVKQIRKSVHIQIYFPKSYKNGQSLRTLIGLHGYNGSSSDWENYTSIESDADKYNFIIVCPSMGKTLYESAFFPETVNKWDGMPGGRWIVEILIPYLRENFLITQTRENTGIFGLSTGARGAILLSAQHTDIFGAAAGFSGDYDPMSTPRDKLLTSVYGSYYRFKERWKKTDNIIDLAVNLKNTPVLLGHGEKDYKVPVEQSGILAIRLLQLHKKHGGYIIKYFRKKYALHEWSFWRYMLPHFMDFFNEHLKG